MGSRILFIKGSSDYYAMTFPLGVMHLSSSLKAQHPEVETRLVDLRLAKVDLETLRGVLNEFNPTHIAISLITQESSSLGGMLTEINDAGMNEVPIIVGGPYTSSDPDGCLSRYSEVDFVCVGEGERTFREWFDAVESGVEDFSKIDGLWWRREDGSLVENGPRKAIAEADEIPFPDYGLPNMEEYWNEWSMCDISFQRNHQYMSMFTSRACPYKCTYCHTIFDKGFRAMSPQRVIAQMEHLMETYGIRQFEFLDDIFNFNRQRVLEICKEIVRRDWKVDLSFPNALRCDRLDDEMVEWLARAGTKHTSVAVETASPRLQKVIRKNLKLDLVEKAIDACHRNKIMTRGFFMIGFPSETREEIESTIQFAKRSKLTTAMFFTVLPFRGTELERENRELVQAQGFGFENDNYENSVMNISTVTDRELVWLQRTAILRFALMPRRIWYLIRLSPSFFRFADYFIRGVMTLLYRASRKTVPNLKKASFFRSSSKTLKAEPAIEA